MERRKSRRTVILAISLVLLLNVGQFVSAEIPHENYDLVSTDLDMVVQLLTQGINMTERALISCLDDRPANASRNLTLLDSILLPTTQLITQIQDVATSYYSLRYLTPPFENLSLGGRQLVANQTVFLSDFDIMKGFVGRLLLSTEASEARLSMAEARTAIFSMNNNLDTLDGAASEIANLTVRNSKAFNTAYLEELIDLMRGKLEDYVALLDSLFFIIQWGEPFVLLVLNREVYPLGDVVKITGYLSSGSFPQVGKPVELWKDGVPYSTVITGVNGTFDSYWRIPMEKGELGYHNLSAQAILGGYFLNDSKFIQVVRVPTELMFFLNSNRFSPGDVIVATAYLKDFRGHPVHQRFVKYIIDNVSVDLITSAIGMTELRMNASDFNWGSHTIAAYFYGTEIYEPSSNDTQHFDINLNTSLSLKLSDNRVVRGAAVTITATLYANGIYSSVSRPLPDRDVALLFDDNVMVTGTSGEDGTFVFVLNTSRVPAGTHIIKALFLSHEPKYEDAISVEQVLVIYVPSSGENGGGGWWHMVSGNFLWLILLILIIIILTILMLSKERIQGAMKPEDGLRRKARLKGAGADEGLVESEATRSSGPPVSGEMSGLDFSTMLPRVAVVKRYGILLEALKGLRKVPIRDNMTAREIGELLRTRGYPDDETTKLTAEFERAMYSAREITPEDWERFSALADTIEHYTGGAR